MAQFATGEIVIGFIPTTSRSIRKLGTLPPSIKTVLMEDGVPAGELPGDPEEHSGRAQAVAARFINCAVGRGQTGMVKEMFEFPGTRCGTSTGRVTSRCRRWIFFKSRTRSVGRRTPSITEVWAGRSATGVTDPFIDVAPTKQYGADGGRSVSFAAGEASFSPSSALRVAAERRRCAVSGFIAADSGEIRIDRRQTQCRRIGGVSAWC